jgi:hypothetical protein
MTLRGPSWSPRSHFIDRSALLDALAERGFIRLADEIREAASHVTEDYARALHAAGSAYVGFAVRESALLDLRLGRDRHRARGASRLQAARERPARPIPAADCS